MSRRIAFLCLAIVLAVSSLSAAGTLGFREEFALAPDRATLLKQLVPGTDAYYYYHSLHYLQTQQFEQLDETLKNWMARNDRDPRLLDEIRIRQALASYPRQGQETLDLLGRNWLGVQLHHQQRKRNPGADLPHRLDQNAISRKAFAQRFALHSGSSLGRFKVPAMDWLPEAIEFNYVLRRNYLRKIQRPDYPDLVETILRDLSSQGSGGFGYLPIHSRLTLAQLDEILRKSPNLRNDSSFVYAYISRLRPPEGVDWRHDKQATRDYYARLWQFVDTLGPAHNSLKANVLYHLLKADRARGAYDWKLFLGYLKLPRQIAYVEPDYLRDESRRRYMVNLSADFGSKIAVGPIHDDQELVKSYFLEIFRRSEDWEKYNEYVRSGWLKRWFAEAKILSGQGDPEKWASLLSPAEYQQLKERVDIDFAYTRREHYLPGQDVTLNLKLKNIQTLLVKIYKVDTLNYYRSRSASIGTDIQLDGLVPNAQKKVRIENVSPFRQVRRAVELPEIQDRGVYVVDFIGNGKASRALIRVGKLHYFQTVAPSGQSVVLTVFNESNQLVEQAAVHLGLHRYQADENGRIYMPLSSEPGRKRIILESGNFATLDWLNLPGANYRLQAGFHVEQEDLLGRSEATVIVHPRLLLENTPLSIGRLEDIELDVRTQDLDGIAATRTFSDLKATMDQDLTATFRVPPRLASIHFTLRAKIEQPTTGKKIDLSAGQSFQLNGIDKTSYTHDLHLVRLPDGWAIDVLGKSGEILPDRPVRLDLRHRDVTAAISVSLKSDKAGRIHLGALKEIEHISAGSNGVARSWTLPDDRYAYPSLLHAKQGRPIRIPYMGQAEKPLPSELSLLETRSGQFYADRFDALSIQDGFVEITGLDPGDYSLWIKPAGAMVTLRVEDGEVYDSPLGSYVQGDSRSLELPEAEPMQIVSVTSDDENVLIRLANPSKLAVVHLTAVRFVPAYDLYSDLAVSLMPLPESLTPGKATTSYVTGRDIGDEYRYVLNRKDFPLLPGSMLSRPGLILNPWALRKTQTGVQKPSGGTHFEGEAEMNGRGRESRSGQAPESGKASGSGVFSNLNFLAQPAVVMANLVPDENGIVTVPRKLLEGKHHLHVVAADPYHYVYRSSVLAEPDAIYRDLRLTDNLDPEKHFIQKRKIQAFQAGETFRIADIKTAQMEIYDSLPAVYGQYLTLLNDPKLREFAFLMNWPELTDEQKRQKYSRFACHELHFFLSRKDPEFFNRVVKGYLANKKDKTFMDHYLLGDSDALREVLQPWSYSRLNMPERVLLGKALPGETPHMQTHIQDLLDLLPPESFQPGWYFRAGLAARGLEDGKMGYAGKDMSDDESAGRLHTRPMSEAEPSPRQSGARREIQSDSDKLQEKEMAKRKQDALARRRKTAADTPASIRFELDLADEEEMPAALYRRLEKTTEWAENNYYKLPIEAQNASLVDVNEFWNDFARHEGQEPFLSEKFSQASGNFTEAVLALALLDLPFQAKEHDVTTEGDTRSLKLAGPALIFHRQIQPVEKARDKTPILISQNFFRADDRYRQENNQRVDKFVTEEFLTCVVYGAQVVITNPTSSRQDLSVLIQTPRGAMPVQAGQYTQTVSMDLQPYHTQKLEYYFYFPASGDFPHYPVHVSRDEELLASAESFSFHVVAEPSKVDTESWPYISQYGSEDEVIAFIKQNNPQRLSLELIAWRMRDKTFYRRALDLLSARHVYNQTLWGYSFLHNDPARVEDYLKHSDSFIAKVGPYLKSPLLTIDPVERTLYQHLEYRPLVNARRHRLGRQRRIPNERIYQQYTSLLEILIRKGQLSHEDNMAIVYYLLLQDRVHEAMERFETIDPDALATRLQYDYFQVYLAFYQEDLEKARRITDRYKDYPVERWRKIFAAAGAQLDQIQGQDVALVDPEDRNQQQTRQAQKQPSLEMKVEDRKVTLNYQNLSEVKVNYYLMDIELLFSRKPFVQGTSQQFSYVQPNHSQRVELDEEANTHTFELPERFHSANVLVEVQAGALSASETCFANSMRVQIVENYGQLKVASAKTGKPLSKVYVKVYARTPRGEKFFKDGYTDLRGRFDYTSLSSDEIEGVSRFAILVLSEEHGAVVREASPPQR